MGSFGCFGHLKNRSSKLGSLFEILYAKKNKATQEKWDKSRGQKQTKLSQDNCAIMREREDKKRWWVVMSWRFAGLKNGIGRNEPKLTVNFGKAENIIRVTLTSFTEHLNQLLSVVENGESK